MAKNSYVILKMHRAIYPLFFLPNFRNWKEEKAETSRQFCSLYPLLLQHSCLGFWCGLQRFCSLSWHWSCGWAHQRICQRLLYYKTESSNVYSNEGRWFYAHTRRLWDPGLKIVHLFIVVKQWHIVLPQHKRSICSCGREVENSSHFFPSSLPKNLQTPFCQLSNYISNTSPVNIKKITVTCNYVTTFI